MGLTTKESVWYSLIKLCIGCALGFVHAKREACACANYVNRPDAGRKALGWFLHYAIGVVFALAHIAVFGHHWLVEPSLTTGLITGAVTLVFPFLVIQPCLEFGFAASKTPTPWKARFLSTLAHLAYGLGLFITAFAIKGVSQYFM